MTSRNSFTSHCIEDMKHNLPQIVITFFVFIFAFLGFVLNISNLFAEYDGRAISERIGYYCQPGFSTVMIALPIAVGLAVSAFTHLHIKKQADFYNALPITREEAFLIRLCTSFVTFIVPAIIYTIAKSVLLILVGEATGQNLGYVWITLLCMTVCFLNIWLTATLAMILTGHFFVGILGFGVFASYFPLIIQFLPTSYMSTFFATYTYGHDGISEWLNYLSPISIGFEMVTDAADNWTLASHGIFILAALVWIIVLGIIDYKLYTIRPSESAGHAMVFEKWNSALRFALVIPMTLYAGIFLIEIATNRSIIWLYLGILLGGFVFHAIVECIFQMDIKAITSHKLHLGITWIVCFIFSTIFMKDVFHYDEWIPAKEDIETIVLSTDETGDTDIFYYGDPSFTFTPDGLTGENIDICYDMVQEIIDTQLDTMKANHLQWTNDAGRQIPMNVQYKLKNGQTKTRAYSVDPTMAAKYLDPIYATEDYKNDIYRLYTIDRSKIKLITWDNTLDYEVLNYKEDEMNEFLDTYLDELTQIDFTELHSTSPIGQLQVSYNSPVAREFSSESYYYIYPSFTKTLDFLKEHGIEKVSPFDDYPINKLEITVSHDDEFGKEELYQITDPELIDKYRSELKNDTFFSCEYGVDFDYYINVIIHEKTSDYYIAARVSSEVATAMIKDAEKVK